MESVVRSALINKAFGENIHNRREFMNLTHEELAEKIGVTPGFLALVERGRRSLEIEKLLELSDALEISVDALLSIKGTSAQDDNALWPGIEEIFAYLQRMDKDGIEKIVNVCKQMLEKQDAN